MPQKIRQLKAALAKAGFYWKRGKGSHTNWKHPALPGFRVTLSGKDGNDAEPYQIDQVAEPYQIDQVQDALQRLERKQR